MAKEVEKEVVKSEGTALVTSRVLFITVLDKILLVIITLIFLMATYRNFAGTISSTNYGYWSRVGREIITIFGAGILYLFTNWLYQCVSKTMLCLTENEVYKESYIPFKRTETSIPLNKITSVSTFKAFWIFRCIMISQYGRLPMVFWTWNSQEFKDKLNELITTNKEKIENKFEYKNIISKNMIKYIVGAGVVLAAIIGLIGIIKFFSFAFGEARKIPGTYTSGNNEVILNKDNTCSTTLLSSSATDCKWTFEDDKVTLTYKNYYGYSEYTGSKEFTYQDNTLNSNGIVYSKK